MAISPMMQHYLETKEKHKDCIVMYRLGDFYEMFFDDAVTVSRELNLTLTGRDCGLKERAPMCGVPYHAVDAYIASLVERGYKVAICEQLTAPEKGTLVERDVVRIVTAGTITESELLDEKNNNYLAAVFFADEKVGLAWSDISTGEFNMNQFEHNALSELSDALVRIAPSEIICNETMLEAGFNLPCVRAQIVPKFSMYHAAAWEYSAAESALEGFLPEGKASRKRYAVCAAGALMAYIADMQKRAVENVKEIVLEDDAQILYLDAATRKNLELTTTLRDAKSNKGTLLWLLDKTKTSMGRRRLRAWIESPLRNPEAISNRQDCVEELKNDRVLLSRVQEHLGRVLDLERLCSKASYRTKMTPRDLSAIHLTLNALPDLCETLASCRSSGLRALRDRIDPLEDLRQKLYSAVIEDPPALVREGGFVKEGYCADLDEIKKIGAEAETLLAAMETAEKQSTGIRNLRIGFNRVFGYYIEVSKSQAALVPYTYQRKQTTVNGERFITPELKELEEKILGGKERALAMELEIFEELCAAVRAEISGLQTTSKAISALDCFASLAQVAADYGYVRPEVADDGVVEIREGRHPTIERMTEEPFVPNDTFLNQSDNRIMVITGPNMAGKSTYMRQVALLVIMSHIGSFVPAKYAHIALTDRVFTRIGASDDLLTGHSTFMVEMLEVANILEHATEKSLLLLDEIGRGTSTYDGLSIAWAVTEYLSQNLKAKTLFSTHYHELTDLEQRLEGVKNYRISVRELNGTIVFLHKIARGCAMRSYGIEVASLAGIRQEVVDRAKVILNNLQQTDIANEVAGKVMEKQATMFDTVSLKGYHEAKDILKDLDFDRLTPIKAFEILVDLAQRLKD